MTALELIGMGILIVLLLFWFAEWVIQLFASEGRMNRLDQITARLREIHDTLAHEETTFAERQSMFTELHHLLLERRHILGSLG